MEKGIHQSLAKFTKKTTVGLQPATLLKKTLRHRCFLVNYAKILRTLFL